MKHAAVSLMILASAVLMAADDPAPTWTSDVAKMQFPEGAAKGKLRGADFTIDKVALDPTGALTLQQGTEIIPDAAIIIFLPVKSAQAAEGKKFEFGDNAQGDKPTAVHAKRKPAPNALPKGSAYLDGYALKLEFGKEKDGKIPAKIYICLPDDGKSVVAGTFTLEVK